MKRGIRAGITFNVLAIGLATVAPAGYAGPALPNSGTLTWSIRPTEVVPRTGEATAGQLGRTAIREFDPYPLAAAVNTVQATIDATIPAGSQAAVDIRGLRGDGTWSEWVEIIPNTFAVLPERTCSVQTRLVLTAPTGSAVSTVRSIDLAAWDAGGTASTRSTAAGDTYTVFATREGLVGRTTANGHVITDRDHFAALPSRRGLASKNSGDYTVRVCTTDGSRCTWAPVWDVGPWNTKDDYWNAGRQSWPDLPQGKPEAQAAYTDGYNGGKDQFGRTVSNPAGIDLADGAFWDGLELIGNASVNVTFQWTGSGAWGTVVTAVDPLNVRAGAKTSSPQAGLAARGAQVRIECALTGESVNGPQGTSSRWFRLAPGKYVSSSYIRVDSAPNSC
jgi:hypothetical protein